MTLANRTGQSKATRREWIGLAVLALPCLLYSMDLSVLNLAVPQLVADLRPTSAQLLWIVDIYGFLVAGSLITMGTLGDRIGRRKLLLIGAVAFGAASVVAAFSTTPHMLIAARAMLGVAAATLAPSTLSLLRNMFHDPRERSFAIAVWITAFSVGGAIGPVVGGLLLHHFWWGSVFLIALPVMALLLVLGPFLLPEFRDDNAGRIDLVSAAMSLVAVLSVIFGLKQLASGSQLALALVAIIAGLAVGVAFVRRQQHLADPLIDLSLFGFRAFSVSLTINTLAFFVAFSSFLLVAQYLQLVLGMTPLEAGLWSLPSALAFIIGTPVAPAFSQHFRPASLVAAGLLTAAAGFVILALAGAAPSLAAIVAGTTVMSIGLVPVFTLVTDLIVSAAPPERAGSAAAVSETGIELGGSLGIALIGSLAGFIYRLIISGNLPADLPAATAAAARDSLAMAVDAAAQLDPSVAGPLVEQARGAFSSAFAAAALVSAGIMALTAAIAFFGLLQVQASRHGPH